MNEWLNALQSFLPERDVVVALTRILFGSIFFIKLSFSFQAHKMLWGHGRPAGIKSDTVFFTAQFTLLAAVFFFTLGLFTQAAGLIAFLLYVYFFRYATLFGMDDVVCQSMWFYFLFADSGAVYSLDHVLQRQSLGRFQPSPNAPELMLALVLGSVFFSAGIKKLQSPMWRKGLAVYTFFLLPLHRRFDTDWITRRKTLVLAMNYFILALQIVFLPTLLINAAPLGFLLLIPYFGFAFTLCTIFVFTWLGELLLVSFLPILWLTLELGKQGLGSALIQAAHDFAAMPHSWIFLPLLLSLVAVVWTAIVPHLIESNLPRFIKSANKFLRTIARLTWGFLPVDLFGERHTQGVVIYRVFAEFAQEPSREIFAIFSKDCKAGPHRNFRPTFVEVTQYKIGEACIEMDKYGEVRTELRKTFLLNLSQYICESTLRAQSKNCTGLLFKTLQLNPPTDYNGCTPWYLEKQWQDSFRIAFKNGQAETIEILAHPILEAPSGRDVERLSFSFNPDRV